MIHDLHFHPDGTLRPTASLDHFEFFGLPRALTLDEAALEADYFALSRRFHPDFFVGADADQQILALEKTSALNNAYRVLKDPTARAEYIVELETGTPFGESGEQNQVPRDLLMDVMEVRERIMDWQMGETDEAAREQLNVDKTWAETQRRESDHHIAQLAEEWDEARAQVNNEAALASVVARLKDALSRRRYFNGLIRDIDKAL
jgi:molecular chaperone HscB